MKREQFFSFGLAVLAVGFALHALALDYVTDDAFISFRYARNLLDGHGLVYNPGERVEGYTNFLWTVLLAGVDLLLPGENLPGIARVLGVLFGCAAIFVTGDLAREVAPTWYGSAYHASRPVRTPAVERMATPALLLAPALLAADSSFALWTTGGLESPMFAFLCTAGALAYVRWTKGRAGALAAPMLFALASLTRPDGALLFAVTAAFEVVRRRGKILAVARWCLPFVVVFGGWFVWRWNYYGWFLPNTFYAKVGGGSGAFVRGAQYVGRFLASHAWFVAPAPLFLLGRRGREAADEAVRIPNDASHDDADTRVAERVTSSPRGVSFAYLGSLVAAHTAFVVAVGGDGLFSYRFCTYLAPVFYVLVQAGLARALGKTGGLYALAGVLAVLLNAQISWRTLLFPESQRWTEPQSELSFPGNGADHDDLFFDPYFVERQERAARWLEENAAPGALIASTPAGSIAYYSSHPVIDMLGLNDEHIAHVEVEDMGRGRPGHEKGDGAYVLSRRPEYILLGNVAVLPRPLMEEEMPAKLVRRSEHEIWADPGFHRDYERVCVEFEDGTGADSSVFRYFTFYRRKQIGEH